MTTSENKIVFAHCQIYALTNSAPTIYMQKPFLNDCSLSPEICFDIEISDVATSTSRMQKRVDPTFEKEPVL